MPAVTVNLSDVQRKFGVNWVDTLGGDHPEPVPPGYASPFWSVDNPTLAGLPAGIPQGETCPVNLLGPGTFNLTATAKKTGAPDIVGTVAVTIQGPVPSHLNVLLQPL